MRSINQIGAVQPGRVAPVRPPAPTRAALYVRVSTQAQADKWSLPSQRKLLAELAVKRGWDAMLYDEGGVSAETIGARPVMRRLLDDVAAGRIDLVAVVEMERLCRASDLRDWATISTTFREAGVPVATPERIFNLEAAEDDFEADLRGILSKREKRKLLERTHRGLEQARDAGRFIGGQPMLGYRYDHATRKIVPDPETVPLVTRIFESNLGAWALCRQLKNEGIEVGYQKIQRIRTHPWYVGKRVNSEGQLIDADWPAIIDEELWGKWQKRPRRLARRGAPNAKPTYFLSGMIRCARCGKSVVGTPIAPSKTGMPLFIYKCLEPKKCPGKGGQLSGWLVDLLVLDALKAHAGDPEVLKDRYARAMEDAGSAGASAERDALKAQVRDLEARQARLVDAVEQALLPDHVIRKRQKALDAEMKLARSRLDATVDAAIIPSLPDLRAILALAEGLETAGRDGQRELLERLATAVEVDPRTRTLTVVWRLGGESRYRVPLFRGGPGRSVEAFMERAAAAPGEFVVP